ncbi:MAG: DUF4174 domain-containing protein [Pararhodobacter sp.]|nr:DUF4174 domain-containing protein [Pararhodobacter sp.]
MTLPMKPVLLALLIATLPMAALADEVRETLAADAATETAPDGAADPLPEDVEITPEGLRIVDATEVEIDDLIWEWRVLAVMADTPNDPAFIRQMRDINERAADLFERDVVVVVDTDRASGSSLRLRLRPRGFMLAIIDKDGEVKQRRPAPRDVRELNAVIDRFPLRRQEMMERRPSGR